MPTYEPLQVPMRYPLWIEEIFVDEGGLTPLSSWLNQPLLSTSSPKFSNLTVNGDLLVLGVTTELRTSNLDVEDNIITVNYGETAAGVSLSNAGILVDRGTLSGAYFLYRDNLQRFSLEWSNGSLIPLAIAGLTASNLDISGTVNIGGATKISNALAVSDATTLYSTLNVGGVATFSDAVGIGTTPLAELLYLYQSNSLPVKIRMDIYSAAANLHNWSLKGADSFFAIRDETNAVDYAAVKWNGLFSVVALNVSNTTTLYSTVNVGGVVTISNSLSVSNAATLYSTVNVGGVGTFSGALNVGGSTKVSNAFAVSDATTLYSTLNVGGAVTISNAVLSFVLLGFDSTKMYPVGGYFRIDPTSDLVIIFDGVNDQALRVYGSAGNRSINLSYQNAVNKAVIQGLATGGAGNDSSLELGTTKDGVPRAALLLNADLSAIFYGTLAVSDATTLYSTVAVGGVATFSGGINKIGSVAPADQDVLTWSAGDSAYIPKALPPGELTGVIKAYGGATAPSGYLLCDGTCYSNPVYAALYSVIGQVFGFSTANDFKVPDLRQRFPLGKAAAGTGSTLGGTGGTIDHTHTYSTVISHTHTISGNVDSESAHTHGVGSYAVGSESAHTHPPIGNAFYVYDGVGGTTPSAGAGYAGKTSTGAGSSHTHGFSGTSGAGSSHTHGTSALSAVATGSASGTTASANPPFQVVNYIIKT